jgi:hypothetical protein
MSRFSRLIPVVAVTILLAACGQDGANPVAPDGPSLDGGILVTGGNRTEPDSTTGTPNSNATGDGETQTDTTGRGGILVTGGN